MKADQHRLSILSMMGSNADVAGDRLARILINLKSRKVQPVDTPVNFETSMENFQLIHEG